ncbi:MAG: hypothetical protein FVQ77_15295 [Cytophagales bacterium]|nr:hypothetical protein [Cytophagales bacterium]
MEKKPFKILIFLFSILLSQYSCLFSQNYIVDDKVSEELIVKGIDKLYNYEFEEAEVFFKKLKVRLPHHPIYPLLMALMTYWEMMPVFDNKALFDQQEAYLARVLELSDSLLENDENNVELFYAKLTAHSYLSLLHSENNSSLQAVNEARKAYAYMKKGFKLKEQYPEFYFSTGLYNYYVVQYPETHPLYKPFMFFFPGGDKQKGLKQLKLAAQKAVFSKVEALEYLAHIYLKYESSPYKAIEFTQKLVDHYPKNLYMVTRHTEALIASAKYEDARPFISKLMNSGNDFFIMTGQLFVAITREKYMQNYLVAKTWYLKAITSGDKFEDFAHDYLSFAYTGLARIAIKEGNDKKAEKYYKKALDLTEYQWVIQEAKEYLDQ